MSQELHITKNHPLKSVCTLGIGGPAEIFIEVHTTEGMQQAISFCHEKNLRYLILGKGSNTLFDDRGFRGAVIHNKIDFIKEHPGGQFHVGGGYSFSLLGAKTARKGWSGLEFASGIPGTVGGAIFMNAGANGKETCEHLEKVGFVDNEGNFTELMKQDVSFGYRSSTFQQLPGAIVSAVFKLLPSDQARKKQLEIIDYRIKTQPYGQKSAGCMFRNPTGQPAGYLIEKSGLKGYRLGGAKVSELHANFIVNTKEGSSKDVLELITCIKERVKKETGIELESEVRCIPYEEVR